MWRHREKLPLKPRRGLEQILPSWLLEQTNPTETLTLDFPASETVRQHIPAAEVTSLWYLLQPQETNIPFSGPCPASVFPGKLP